MQKTPIFLVRQIWRTLTISLLIGLSILSKAQTISPTEVIKIDKLSEFLNDDVKKQLTKNGSISQADLAQYLRDKFSERYFYDWKTFQSRFNDYNSLYSGRQKSHGGNAEDHMAKFADSTKWKLPFDYLNGKPVNAYAIRHLARQHKMVDIAFTFFYERQDPKYIKYFCTQMRSLNVALAQNAYETIDDGNGVYEAFSSGFRALNWILVHNLFLGQAAYTDADQLTTIATLLQQGANLYANNAKFTSGNHQTKGMSSLAMISILLRDFKGTDKWNAQAMKMLEAHLKDEVNPDGFQFERTVHYHISDIENYYYVYQLAKISNLPVSKAWEDKLKSLFVSLTKIGYPDKSAPVLQDDTNKPMAEKNDISGALTLGYLLFNDPTFGYFANNKVESDMYWYLSATQIASLQDIKKTQPEFKSVDFPQTGYYIMRPSWKKTDPMMIISAGLDAKKPDHQHGDMLGIQAMANGSVILPNYQVNYPLPDYELFKNSLVKNVALVDDELQGKEWTGNEGGSGFGKFKKLPKPKVIAWLPSKDFDIFIGTHDGFKNIGVNYTRQVISVNGDFWIVKDNFSASKEHTYKQVWQGHYTNEVAGKLLRSTFENASGCDIYQVRNTASLTTSGAHGKQWNIVSAPQAKDFSFLTIVSPFSTYSNRIDETDTNPKIGDWTLNKTDFTTEGQDVASLSKKTETLFFGVNKLKLDKLTITFTQVTDVYLKFKDGKINLQLIGDSPVSVSFLGTTEIKYNDEPVTGNVYLLPGESISTKLAK
jgi:hypothetical protein